MKSVLKTIVLITFFTGFAQEALSQINVQVWLEYIPTFV